MPSIKKMPLLGNLTPAQFMRDYWQKKPLLIRQAIPQFSPVVDRHALFELASKSEVESRLVSYFTEQWKMQHGPFEKLPSLAKKQWTLLVQGVNLHHDGADELLRQFRFLPDARLDDLMISYATDGGSVGPHFDSYDVFLLQAQGQRHWRIGAQTDLSLVENVPLKILQDFQPDQEFVLEAGDMLYLPPHYAHEGVAVGECMTYSIGFRAPSYQELGEAFLQFMADSVELPGRYSDPELTPTQHPACIGRAMLNTISTQLNNMRFSADDIAIFIGEYLSEPKATVFFEAPQRRINAARFSELAKKRGITLSRKSQMLYDEHHVFINGLSFVIGKDNKPPLAELADRRCLDGAAIAQASSDVQEAFYEWYGSGWLKLTNA